MTDTPAARWQCGTLTSDTTPYGAAYRVAEHVHVKARRDSGSAIVTGTRALRFVTAFQVGEGIRLGSSCSVAAKAEQAYLDLRRRILASPAGRLEPLVPVKPQARPAGISALYQGIPVVVSDTAPVARTPGWLGEHLYDEELQLTIYLETRFARALAAMGRWDWLRIVLEHERVEAAIELALARLEFPEALREQLGGLAVLMNGLAHAITIRLVDGASSEEADNRMDDRWTDALGLPRSK